jgi:hypothetical protein
MTGFEATIEGAPRGGAYVRIPDNVVKALGGDGRIPVNATFDGIEYRGSIVRMGGESILGILKEIRQRLGKELGDEVTVVVSRDQAEREVEVPVELETLLASNQAAREAFDALSYSHRREHAMYVAEAKQAETRERRATKTIESLVSRDRL